MIPKVIPGIKNITISGRIGTGKSTLAQNLATSLNWELMDGGKLFRKYAKEFGFHIVKAHNIPEDFDRSFEEKTKEILKSQENYVFQSHLAGFIAQGIPQVFKILVISEDPTGNDSMEKRAERIKIRDDISFEKAQEEVIEREQRLLEKFRALYANGDNSWVYWDRKYYDLVVNTFHMSKQQALKFVLQALPKDV